MTVRRLASALIVFGLLYPGITGALGLGELTLDSFLNEPLEAEVTLLELGDLDPGQVRVRLASTEDFERAGVERSYFLTTLKFSLLPAGNGNATLSITSADPVREPYLNFIIEARWPNGRLLREYTVLLDPPVFVGSDSGITARASARDSARQPAGSRGGSRAAQGQGETADSRSTSSAAGRYGAGAESSPITGADYVVRRDDTLWQIASAARPSGASVQQTMLDIQRLNPEAFMGDNINRLKAGYVLRLPTETDITPRSFEEAVAAVAEQSRRWQREPRGMDSRLDASEAQDSSSFADSRSGAGHLQIAGADGAEESYSGGDLSARMEDLDRTQRENEELSTRLGSVEQQLAMQERLITLKDEQIAALQEALARAGGDSSEVMEQQVGAVEMPVEPEATDMAPMEPGTGSATADDGMESPVAPTDAAQPVIEAEPEPEPEPEPVAPPPSLLDMAMEYIQFIGAGLAVLVLAVLYLLRNKLPGLSRRRGDQPMPARGGSDTEDEFAGVALSEDSLIVDEFAEDGGESGAAGAGAAMGNFSPAPDEEAYAAQFESGDALAEADIYIAYGRFPQAVDLLKTAINVEPINTDYRMKLMEASVEMVDSGEFQQQYADLQVIGDEHVLQRARDLLAAVDGGEVWLDDLPPPTLSPEDVANARAAMPEAQPAVSVGSSSAEAPEPGAADEFGLDDDLDDLGDGSGQGQAVYELDVEEDEDEDESGELKPIEYELDDDDELADSGDDLDDIEAASLSLDVNDAVLEQTLDEEDATLLADAEELDLPDLELDAGSLGADMELDDLDGLDSLDDTDDLGAAGDELQAELDDLDLGLDADDDLGESLPDTQTGDDLAADLDTDDDILPEGADEELLDLESAFDAELEDSGSEPSASDASPVFDSELDLSGDSALDLDSEIGEIELDGDIDDIEFEGEAGHAERRSDVGEEMDFGDLESDLGLDDSALDLSGLSEDSDVELELDTGEPDVAAPESGSADSVQQAGDSRPLVTDLGDDELNLGDLDDDAFELDDLVSESELESMELDMSEDEDDDNGESLVFASDGDEVATKLDLARAYLDMGDHEGARSILVEVAEEGNQTQVSEAQKLLEGID